jgi:glycosyltransferase involved in cell wall biosynthesis
MVEWLLFRKIKKIVTVSEDLKERIGRFSGINENKILIIRNGIDVERYFYPECREGKRRALGIEKGSFVIGNVARLVRLKNHRFLLDIFKELLKDISSLRLVLVGDGPLRKELEAYARGIGPSNSVMFLGERKDIAEMLSVFDLFILPSLTEGISITLLEAMAAGTPVVASEVGGNPEIVGNEKTGLLLPLHNKQQWIEAIRSLINNENKRKSLSQMARSEISERFNLGKMVENYEKIYFE